MSFPSSTLTVPIYTASLAPAGRMLSVFKLAAWLCPPVHLQGWLSPPSCWILIRLLLLASLCFLSSTCPPTPVFDLPFVPSLSPSLSCLSLQLLWVLWLSFPVLFYCLLIIHCCMCVLIARKRDSGQLILYSLYSCILVNIRPWGVQGMGSEPPGPEKLQML